MESNDPKYTVTIHVYDLSQGMARSMSQMFLGKQIDGIWHTGIVVYNQEYYFGGGICAGPPSQTPYGYPTKVENIGFTQIPQDVFHEFLQSISSKFSLSTYDLFKNNCNNFTEECCQFLTGESIPSYITGLPAEVLNTPLGRMIEPMITNIQNQMINGANNQLLPGMFEGNMNPQALNFSNNANNNSMTAPKTTTHNTGGVYEIKDYTDFSNIIKNNSAVVVDFFSLTCPPCMRIKPIYAQIAQDTSNDFPQIKFCSCNVSQVKDVSISLGVQSIPTFVFYHNGNVINRFSGANESELRKQINNLKNLVGVSPSQSQGFKKNNEIPNENLQKSPFLFSTPSTYEFYLYKSDKKDFPINKIKSYGETKIKDSEYWETFLELASNIDNAFQYFIPEKKRNLLCFVCKNIEKYIENHSDEVIPFYDLLRIMLAETAYCKIFHEEFSGTLDKIIEYFKKDQQKDFQLLPKPIKILILRTLVNNFSCESGKIQMLKKKDEILDLAEKTSKFFSKNDKMCVETCVMIIFNYLLTKDLPKERQAFLLEFLIDIGKKEEGSDSISLGVILSCNFVCFNMKNFIEILKNNEFEKVLMKAKISKNEKVVFAAKDAELICEGKI